MADYRSQSNKSKLDQRARLKHLGFVLAAAVQAMMCLSGLVKFVKDNAGPLRPGIKAVEDKVKAIVGPIYEKARDIPLQLLVLVDRKVDEASYEVDRHTPLVMKKASAASQRALQVACWVADDLDRTGVVATAIKLVHAARENYSPAAEKHAVAAWRWLNQLPFFPHIANIAVPTAAYWSKKYNRIVVTAAGRGYAAAQHLPLVPTERIAKLFGKEANSTASPQ